MEFRIGQFELAHALDKDLMRPVDHDLGDGIVLAQGFNRPETQDFVADIGNEPRLLTLRDGKRVFIEYALAVIANQGLDLMRVLMHRGEHGLLVRCHLIDNALMDTLLDFLIRALRRRVLPFTANTKDIDLTVLSSRPSQARQ